MATKNVKKFNLPNVITTATLKKWNACKGSIDEFEQTFPYGARTGIVSLKKFAPYADWLAEKVVDTISDEDVYDEYDNRNTDEEFIMAYTTWPNRKLDDEVAKLVKTKVPIVIDVKYLQKLEACSDGINEFLDNFETKKNSNDVSVIASEKALAKMNWETIDWLASNILKDGKSYAYYYEQCNIICRDNEEENYPKKLAKVLWALVETE